MKQICRLRTKASVKLKSMGPVLSPLLMIMVYYSGIISTSIQIYRNELVPHGTQSIMLRVRQPVISRASPYPEVNRHVPWARTCFQLSLNLRITTDAAIMSEIASHRIRFAILLKQPAVFQSIAPALFLHVLECPQDPPTFFRCLHFHMMQL